MTINTGSKSPSTPKDFFDGQGLSKWLMECMKAHPDLQGLRRFCLTTKDAHGLYEGFGFQVTKAPGYWMEIKDNDIYKRMSGKLRV